MKQLKIGITIGLKSASDSIWTNGIKLNVLMFTKLLKQSTNNYDVCLLNTLSADLTAKRPDYLKGIPVHPFADAYEDMDLLILMGAAVDDGLLKRFKSRPNKKVVSYRCGNDYVLYTEGILFGDSRKAYPLETQLDEVWYIPQQHETNSGFFRTLHRVEALQVPFVWDRQYILSGLADIHAGYKTGSYRKDYAYQPKDKKVIGVMEPNLNTIKFCLVPLMIAEESYRGETGRAHIQKVMLTNAEKLASHKTFMDVVKSFDLYADGKVFAEKRYQTVFFLTQHADVLVCHQLLNPLNYLYLDAAYMGYPVLHNAPLVKDLGYYYEGSDTAAGARQLDWILQHHDDHRDDYEARNRSVLRRYEATNPELVAVYDRLIDGLWQGGNESLTYNPRTNLYF